LKKGSPLPLNPHPTQKLSIKIGLFEAMFDLKA
jgi:hypothetical protein